MDVVGDMSRALVLRTNQVKLREEMDQLAVEVATGFVRDPGQTFAKVYAEPSAALSRSRHVLLVFRDAAGDENG